MDGKLRIVAVWAGMYADWEEGRSVSPSVDDLARVAFNLWGIAPLKVDYDFMTDRLDEYSQASTTLEEQVDYLAEMVDGVSFPPSDDLMTYDQYAAYAARVGATPYTRTAWDAMSSTHKALLTRLAGAA